MAGYKHEDWNFEENGYFHPKFTLQDESFLLRVLPEISNDYLNKLRLVGQDDEFDKDGYKLSKKKKKSKILMKLSAKRKRTSDQVLIYKDINVDAP